MNRDREETHRSLETEGARDLERAHPAIVDRIADNVVSRVSENALADVRHEWATFARDNPRGQGDPTHQEFVAGTLLGYARAVDAGLKQETGQGLRDCEVSLSRPISLPEVLSLQAPRPPTCPPEVWYSERAALLSPESRASVDREVERIDGVHAVKTRTGALDALHGAAKNFERARARGEDAPRERTRVYALVLVHDRRVVEASRVEHARALAEIRITERAAAALPLLPALRTDRELRKLSSDQILERLAAVAQPTPAHRDAMVILSKERHYEEVARLPGNRNPSWGVEGIEPPTSHEEDRADQRARAATEVDRHVRIANLAAARPELRTAADAEAARRALPARFGLVEQTKEASELWDDLYELEVHLGRKERGEPAWSSWHDEDSSLHFEARRLQGKR